MLDHVGGVQDDSASEQRKAHARRLLKRIKAFSSDVDDRAKKWDIARKYVNGDQDEGAGAVRVNQIGSAIETIQPTIYAKAPEIAVTVDDHVDSSAYPLSAPFSETLQAALNTYLVKDAFLKQRGKAAVRSALTVTQGWVKVIYQVDRSEDPIIRNRINDTQDNVDQIKALVEETKAEGGQCHEHEAKLFELEQQLTALEAKVEVVTSEGLVIDNIRPDDMIVMDESCRDVDEFPQASEICHKIKMTVGSFKQQFRKEPPTGSKRYVRNGEVTAIDVDNDDQMVMVFEVWSKRDLTVYTMCEGAPVYIREPYQPTTLGAQWYPFFCLQLRRVDGERYPLSIVEQAIDSADEFNLLTTSAKEHRRKNIPVRVFNKSAGITDSEIRSIANRTINTDVLGITVDLGKNTQEAMGAFPEIPYNREMYDTTATLRNLETVMNVQDASRGAINKAKTATEAEIMSMGMQSRSSEAIDIVEDWLSAIAVYSAQMILQQINAATIKRRFGEESVWPDLDKKTLFDMVNISVRVGSTTRPNMIKERDQWLQIYPLIQESIQRIAAYKQAGSTEMIETEISLMDETLRRFDEKLDAKTLLGISNEEEDQKPQQPPVDPAMLQQIEQAKAEIEQGKAEIEQAKRELEMKQIQFDADVRVAAAEAKAANMHATMMTGV